MSWAFCLLTALSARSQQEVQLPDGSRLTPEKCLQLASAQEATGNLKEASRFLNLAANAAWEAKNYPQAIQLYEKSLGFNQAIGNENGISMINSNLGMIHADAREYEKALVYFQQTLRTRQAQKEKTGIIAAHINLSVVLNNLKRYPEAIQHLEEALKLATEASDIRQMRGCYGMLAETWEKAGNAERTKYYFELYRTFHELEQRNRERNARHQTENSEKRAVLAEAAEKIKMKELLLKDRELARQELQFDKTTQLLTENNTKQELAIQLLQQENENKTLRLNQKETRLKNDESLLAKDRIFITWLIAGLMLISVLLAGLAIIFYQKRQLNIRLQATARQVLSQNADLESQSAQLRQQADRLTALNAQKDKILAILSHDLRGPLTTLKGSLYLVGHDLLTQEEFVGLAGSLEKSVESLLGTIENILQWSKSQMEGVFNNPQPLRLDELAAQVTALYAQAAENKGIVLSNEIPTGQQVFADKNQLQLILRNLVGNALKFTMAGGYIRIASEMANDLLQISVADTGVGMSSEKTERLFNPQTHFSERGTGGEKGSGLGLMLCREFTEKNGGTLRLESQPGEGTTVSFTLPIEKKHTFTEN